MDSALAAAYELIFAWGYRVASKKELVMEEEVMQLFPTSDPLEWDHLPVQAEKEQAY